MPVLKTLILSTKPVANSPSMGLRLRRYLPVISTISPHFYATADAPRQSECSQPQPFPAVDWVALAAQAGLQNRSLPDTWQVH